VKLKIARGRRGSARSGNGVRVSIVIGIGFNLLERGICSWGERRDLGRLSEAENRSREEGESEIGQRCSGLNCDRVGFNSGGEGDLFVSGV
jgi:hypothetical protein